MMLKLIPVSCQSATRLARNWGPVVSIRPAVIFPVQGVTVLILSGDASYRATGYMSPRLPTVSFFSSLRSKSKSQLSRYCVVGESSWCRCQRLTTVSTNTAVLVTVLDSLIGSRTRPSSPQYFVIFLCVNIARNSSHFNKTISFT